MAILDPSSQSAEKPSDPNFAAKGLKMAMTIIAVIALATPIRIPLRRNRTKADRLRARENAASRSRSEILRSGRRGSGERRRERAELSARAAIVSPWKVMSTSNYHSGSRKTNWMAKLGLIFTEVCCASEPRLRLPRRAFEASFRKVSGKRNPARFWRRLGNLNIREPSRPLHRICLYALRQRGQSEPQSVSTRTRSKTSDLPQSSSDSLDKAKHVGSATTSIETSRRSSVLADRPPDCFGSSRGRLRHQLIDAVAFALEGGQHLSVEFAGSRELDRHRINEVPVDDDFVVQVRPGRQTRLPQIADHLSLSDMHSGGDSASESGEVVVSRDVAVGVLDFDPPSVPRIPFGLDHDAGAGGVARGADRRGPIDPGMHAGEVQDRVVAHAKSRH